MQYENQLTTVLVKNRHKHTQKLFLDTHRTMCFLVHHFAHYSNKVRYLYYVFYVQLFSSPEHIFRYSPWCIFTIVVVNDNVNICKTVLPRCVCIVLNRNGSHLMFVCLTYTGRSWYILNRLPPSIQASSLAAILGYMDNSSVT